MFGPAFVLGRHVCPSYTQQSSPEIFLCIPFQDCWPQRNRKFGQRCIQHVLYVSTHGLPGEVSTRRFKPQERASEQKCIGNLCSRRSLPRSDTFLRFCRLAEMQCH